MEIKNTRPYEAILVSSAFVVYVIRRLFDVADHLNGSFWYGVKQVGISRQQMMKGLAHYSHGLHAMFPIIGGAILLLSAWLIFHLIVCPQAAKHKWSTTLVMSIGLVILLIFTSVFLFHWYMEYVRYSKDRYGHIVGLKVYSLYRKKTVLTDAIGISILFYLFEWVSNIFRHMLQPLLKQKRKLYLLAAYVLLLIPAACLFTAALFADIPTPLYDNTFGPPLLWAIIMITVWGMQAYLIRYLLPAFKSHTNLLVYYLLGFAAIWLVGTGVIWFTQFRFYFYFRIPFIINSGVTLTAACIIVFFRRIFFKEKFVLQQQVAVTSAELAQLRSQINPHFLFNALNSLYAAAMKESANKTADGIQRLGDMMRFMLQENNQERISVEKEFEYLHNYIHLQRIRIDETQGIDVKVVLNQPTNEVYIAPMMLIPFVENAFKHGISHRYPSWIFITLSFDATHLYFRVQNSKHIRQEADPEEYQSGIGLKNVQKRLNLLYPGRHTLQIQESDHDYIASLTLSLW